MSEGFACANAMSQLQSNVVHNTPKPCRLPSIIAFLLSSPRESIEIYVYTKQSEGVC